MPAIYSPMPLKDFSFQVTWAPHRKSSSQGIFLTPSMPQPVLNYFSFSLVVAFKKKIEEKNF
jgi:hypothetical protein